MNTAEFSRERLSSIQRIAASYAGVPADLADYRWILVPWEDREARVPIPGLVSAIEPQAVPYPQQYHEVRIVPGQVDRHGGWRFRFGFHSRARVAALWIEP